MADTPPSETAPQCEEGKPPVEGHVKAPEGQPLHAVHVALHYAEGLHRAVGTDASGAYRICFLWPENEYVLKFSKSGYDSTEVRHRAGEPNVHDVTMQPA